MNKLTAEERYRVYEIVEDSLDDLIAGMREIVDSTAIYAEENMGKSQFSQLSTVTRDTDSVEAVINWIEYQMGRSRPQQNWQKPDKAGKKFGHLVIDYIQEIRDSAASQVSHFHSDIRNAARRAIVMGQVRQLAGQMERYVVAKGKQEQHSA